MLSIERQQIIKDQIYKKGSVRVSELSTKFGVHEETIRRDLKTIAEKWDIELIYGGACLKSAAMASVKEMALIAKRNKNYDAKQIIAKKAAALVEPGDVIALNSGSTVEYILDYHKDKIPFSVVTINVNVAAKASLIDGINVYLPGGMIRGKSGTVIGPGAVDFIKSFSIDKYFVGASAVSIGKGITHPVMVEVELNQALYESSAKSYLVCDSSKIGKNALFKMIDLDGMDSCIVDDNFPDDYKNYLTEKNIQII